MSSEAAPKLRKSQVSTPIDSYGFVAESDGEQRCEAGMAVAASIEAKDELVEIGLEMGASQAVIDAERPGFEVGEDPMDPGKHDMGGQLISATTTENGLTVTCDLDRNLYQKGIQVSDDEMAAINIQRHDFHGEWNYTISPGKSSLLASKSNAQNLHESIR